MAVTEHILLAGDSDAAVGAALREAMPDAIVVEVPTVFDAIAELASGRHTTVLLPTEPIERRPESAVRTIRKMIGNGRVLLFGQPAFEPLNRKMLEHGADDYLITPVSPGELKQVFTSPLRMSVSSELRAGITEPAVLADVDTLTSLPIAEHLLSSLWNHPQDATATAVRSLAKAAEGFGSLELIGASDEDAPPDAPTMELPVGDRVLRFRANAAVSADVAEAFMQRVAGLLRQTSMLQDRHRQLQTLALTDDLTGIYNGRYFRHFLSRIIDRAKEKRFPVTLLLFDIDDFKKYNDTYGHAVGDEILRQAAILMKRCCREHDCVARLGGDEFGVIFWEKEGPRTVRDSLVGGVSGRPPQSPKAIFDRFRTLLSRHEFSGLGTSGKGDLTISAGMAVYPYDAQSADTLYAVADEAVLFRSKRLGKDRVYLVGGENPVSDAPSDDPNPPT